MANTRTDPKLFAERVAELFRVMARGGHFGPDTIHHFNGDLFADAEVLELWAGELGWLNSVTWMDWSAIDPSIFGTLFERALDPDKRSQLGAHYTSREDIETLVEPVVMAPLRREWDVVKAQVGPLLDGTAPPPKNVTTARRHIREFLERLQAVTVLDPACGSGNFLYVTLQKLKDLEKEVIIYGSRYFAFFPQIGPEQLFGIEVNAYAHELAQMTVWIGYLQWVSKNGFGQPAEPILRPLTSFECKDAVLGDHSDGIAREPGWPAAEFIVGNPPFLGGKKLRDSLGDAYVEALFRLWNDRVPAEADYCCYWFEKARAAIQDGLSKRAGLLATQAIRGGVNRTVLDHIKQSGDIFFAVSDRDWILDGATVRVSMIGFDGGQQTDRLLDGAAVPSIHADLTTGVDVTKTSRLRSNRGKCFQGPVKVGKFDIPFQMAAEFLNAPNPNGLPNSDVVRPWLNARGITRRNPHNFIIDFGERGQSEAALYEHPFEYVVAKVRPGRLSNRDRQRRERWWLLGRSGGKLRDATQGKRRIFALPRVAKHRLFVWIASATLPDSALVAFAFDDDYVFGVCQSRIHVVWSRRKGTQLRDVSGRRYTPESTFETFPFPQPTSGQSAAIAHASRRLDELRNRWLFPPEWVQEEVLAFPAHVDGPWGGVTEDASSNGIGVARYTRLVPTDEAAAKQLKKKTLTLLYNDAPTWLSDAHQALDEAVFAAYGWSVTMTDQALLFALVERNQQLAILEAESPSVPRNGSTTADPALRTAPPCVP